MSRSFILILAYCFVASLSFAQDVKFALPLHGTPGKDFWIDYYVDHDTSSGVRDAYCGTKTYDGHQGTDFVIRGFKAMDSGVYIYAVADGLVFKTRDGYYDREKKWVKGKQDNYVAIIHGRKYFVYYDHLMKNSLLVHQGDSVKAGQPIAKVGSSGYSCGPHLHLQVYNLLHQSVDPFSGNCQQETPSLWISQPAYDTAVYAIDNGFVPYIPGYDTLLERFGVRDTFYAGDDKLVCYWVLMHGLHEGNNIKVEWYNPKGNLWHTDRIVWKNNWWFDYNWNYIWMPHKSGTWTAKYYVNNKLIVARNFYVE